ncbi:glutathione-dependent thiol reductase [Methylophaga frappieri]|jgi:arsenate reductase|uniref:Glutathione-dependent thiol reductase n=1 Tax=Methylophaga frappieri (strain ATCC BAA-2434 / DSM 25690 / JAM7) TaxID=754477 RepID=I1YG17_METFJ|nr:ArsC family reductase [Methylophaga frappieri]AFJ01860.1 glutathione-dependent thiol reductase [Methylophaga frappieri]
MIVYGIKNCDTVKKARKWLDQHGVEYQFHDLRTDGLDSAMINQWLKSLSWQLLLNKRSTTWRQLPSEKQENLDEKTAIALMIAHPTLIKRPVICDEKDCLVGFDAQQYLARYDA